MRGSIPIGIVRLGKPGLTGLLVLWLFALVLPADGADKSESRQAAVKKPGNAGKAARRAKRLSNVTAEREAAVLTFVERHHPELTRLLKYLRKNQPRQYQRAVRELSRVAERLAQIHQRDTGRYDLELRVWKVRSRINLLAAKWQMDKSNAVRAQLKTAIEEQLALHKELLERDRQRLRQRLQKLDGQLEQLEAGRQEEVDRRLWSLTEGKRRSKPAQQRGAKSRGSKKDG